MQHRTRPFSSRGQRARCWLKGQDIGFREFSSSRCFDFTGLFSHGRRVHFSRFDRDSLSMVGGELEFLSHNGFMLTVIVLLDFNIWCG